MFNRFVTAIEPFAFALVILAGGYMAGWVEFSNRAIIGIAIVFLGVLLMLKHIWGHMSEPGSKKSNK